MLRLWRHHPDSLHHTRLVWRSSFPSCLHLCSSQAPLQHTVEQIQNMQAGETRGSPMSAEEDSTTNNSKESSANLILCRPVTHLPALMQRLLCRCFPCMQTTALLSCAWSAPRNADTSTIKGFIVLPSKWASTCSRACAICTSVTRVAVFAERAQEVKQNSTGSIVSPGYIVPALVERQMFRGSSLLVTAPVT